MTAGWKSTIVLLVLTAIPVGPLVLWTAAVAAARSLRGLPTGGGRLFETVAVGVKLHVLVLTVPTLAGLMLGGVFGLLFFEVVQENGMEMILAGLGVMAAGFLAGVVVFSSLSWPMARAGWRRLTDPPDLRLPSDPEP